MFEKTKAILAGGRTIFSNHSLADQIDKTHSLFCTGIRQSTDLQRLINFINKSCQTFQKTCTVRNIKTFYEEQRIKPFLYVELSEVPQQKLADRIYNKLIDVPNEVKILKCVGEKKAKKRVDSIKRNKIYQQKKTGG